MIRKKIGSLGRNSKKIEYKSEKACRKAFQNNLHAKFPRSKTKWLPKGMHLDGYNKKMGIAFEFQGIQHYEVDGYFNKTQEDLNKVKDRDKRKAKSCIENHITLIPIKYDLIKWNDQKFCDNSVRNEIRLFGIKILRS